MNATNRLTTNAATTLALFAIVSCATCPPAPTRPGAPSAAGSTAAPAASTQSTSHRTTIDGIDYYYEVHGTGKPLLVLHGGLGSIDLFGPGPMMPVLTKRRQVIAVDLQGHGRTTLGMRPIRCESIANDLDQLLARVGAGPVDVMGYSFGGCVALRLAIQHPERVRRLALVSATFADDGWYADMREQQKQLGAAMAPLMAETPMYKSYKAIAPKDEFPRLLDAMGEFMRQKYDWSAEVKTLSMPVMLVFGDADMIRPEHQIKFYQLLGGGQKDPGWNREHMPKNRLAIVADLTHYEAFVGPRTVETALPFLNADGP